MNLRKQLIVNELINSQGQIYFKDVHFCTKNLLSINSEHVKKLYICIPTNCTQLIYFINNTLKHMYCLKL